MQNNSDLNNVVNNNNTATHISIKLDECSGAIGCVNTGLVLHKSQKIVVDGSRGKFLATVVDVSPPKKQLANDAPSVSRIATEQDVAEHDNNLVLASETKSTFDQLVLKYKLNIRLVDVIYNLDRTRLVFYFSSKDRVDFRDLVKDLAKTFKVFIDLRQVAEKKDHTKLAIVGSCGRQCCCTIGQETKATIKMVKNQGLSLNPNQTIGLCGNIKCCMAFENETYSDVNRRCPKVGGGCCSSGGGCGCVHKINYMKETAIIKQESADGYTLVEYPIDELKSI